jgi:ferritin-like metal-binding protein YciE
LAALETAHEKAVKALEKGAARRTASELRDRIAGQRSELRAEVKRLEQQRRRVAAARAALREQIDQLAKVEAELAARELDARREAQRVLEQMWP